MAQMTASLDLGRAQREGDYPEMVASMERALAVRDAMNEECGLMSCMCPIGFSYVFVSLSPVADRDIPSRLGTEVSNFLYLRWRDPSRPDLPVADDLSRAMTSSRHPLLRSIGYWVCRDYRSFEREALAGAVAGDERMDAMALVAACALVSDRKAALDAVRPILDRGIGLGWDGVSSFEISPSKILDYLEGRIGRDDLRGYFMRPPGI